MSQNYFKIKNGVQVKPSTPDNTEQGDLATNSISGKLEYHNGTSSQPLLTDTSTDVLTNKSIDADTNTITNIENADIKVGAAIDAAKLADGSVSNTEFQYLDGVTGDIQVQLNAKLTSIGSSTDDALVRWSGAGGDVIQNSVVTLSDAGVVAGITQLDVDNLRLDGNTVSNTSANSLVLQSSTDEDIEITPQGTGVVLLGSSNISANTTGTLNVTGQLNADNLRLDGNTVSSTNTSGNILLAPNTDGVVSVEASPLRLPEIATPATPATNYGNIYFKSDGGLYYQNDAGSEVEVANAANAAPSQSYEISNLTLAFSNNGTALTCAVKDQAGNDPSGASVVNVGMRSATPGSGIYNQRTITSALSTTISSGSTAGFTSGNTYTLYWYLIDNAGTLELAWAGVIFDEGSIVSTTAEGGAGGADSIRTLYSTTARSNVPCRLIGRTTHSLATAGTWNEDPDEVALVPFNKKMAIAQANGNPASASSGNPVIFPSTVFDTHNLYNTASGRYTAPFTGYCKVYGTIASGNTAVAVVIYVNAAGVTVAGYTDSNGECAFYGLVRVNAGDLVDIRPNNTLDAGGDSITFEMLSL